MPCSIKRANVRRQLGAAQMFATAQVQQLNSEFTQWCNDSGRASKLAGGAARYLPFLAKLDVALEQRPVELNGALVAQVFSTEELRQMGILSKYFSEIGILDGNSLERKRRSDERLIAAMVDATVRQPWAADIKGYQTELSMRVPPLALRTHKSYLGAAISLLTHAGVARASMIPQKALNSLLTKTPGQRASLGAFVTHLKTVHGNPLVLQSKASKPAPLIRQAKYVRRLLDAVEATTQRPARLALTATLLSKLFKVPLEQILQLRHGDLDLENFRRLRIDGKWLEVPDLMQSILQALPSDQWRSGLDADPNLFPGRLLTDGLSVAGARYHTKHIEKR
jgi:hypothetical protein